MSATMKCPKCHTVTGRAVGKVGSRAGRFAGASPSVITLSETSHLRTRLVSRCIRIDSK
jgi:hypothetical protein